MITHSFPGKDIYSNKYFYILILITLLSVKPAASSWNDYSRMATIQSLVEQHTFIIDNSDFVNTGDKVFINGHYYSDKPVISSIIGAIVYFPLYHVGLELGKGFNVAHFLIVLIVMKTFWLAGLIAFYRSLQIMRVSESTSLFLVFALGFGSLYFTWSTTFNNHLMAASCLIIGYLNIIKSNYTEPIIKHYFYAGFFFALASCIDHATTVFFIGFFVYLYLKYPANRLSLVYYITPSAFTFLPVLLINYYISGQFLPFQIVPSFFDYEGSSWSNKGNLTGTKINEFTFMLEYGFKMLFGKSGFIIYNPFLVIGIPCLLAEIIKSREYKHEAITISICSLVIVLYYIATSSNYSGWSYSIRWFIPLLPFLFIFIFRYMQSSQQTILTYTLLPLLILSCLISIVGVIEPWSELEHTKVPILANITDLIELIGELNALLFEK